MSSKLDQLLQKLCPNGVEFRRLLDTDVANVIYGYPCDASLFNTDGEGLPLVRIRDVLDGMSSTYSSENVPENCIVRKGDLLIGMDGNFHVANWKSGNAILNQRVCKIESANESIVLNGYLSHVLKPIIRRIEDSKHAGTVKHLLDKDLKSIEIPIPPLAVQEEIVRILDKFTELTAEFTAELTARKAQYEWYRDKLLDFSEITNRGGIRDWEK